MGEKLSNWSALPKNLYVTEVRTIDGIVFEATLCSVPMAIGPEVRYARAEVARCEHCDGTGDVHAIDGEWRGLCTCPAGRAALSASPDATAALLAEIEGLRGAAVGAAAALAAAISLLERAPKAAKAAPSDRMFDQMLSDYRTALETARVAITKGPNND